MTHLTIERFGEFFKALHGYDPYPWQTRLAKRVVTGDWPDAIDLPTGSGKTACIDVAVFALACQADAEVQERTAPRRIFFCVNRRIIADEAYNRARRIAKAIVEAEQNGDGVLGDVAVALRSIAGSQSDRKTPPLDVLELRGGIYRDNRWARSITQPTIVCTTIDQLGSRLLFRGYGVSSNAAPIQAALIAYDSIILLDEAHISRPFFQTLDFVRRYLDPKRWAEQDTGVRPAVVVPMTATPPKAEGDPEEHRTPVEMFGLADADRQNRFLKPRLTADKPVELRKVDDKKLTEAAVEAAFHLAGDRPAAVGIMVNRVATAKAIYNALRNARQEPGEKQKASGGKHRRKNKNKPKIASDAVVELVIGSMRPIDRDAQANRLRGLVGPDRPAVTQTTSFIVATQCLEVGADYDFDVLVTECASLDALRQRFGRLNRAGRKDTERKTLEEKNERITAVVLMNKKDIKPEDKLDDDKPLDPIYGNALARTWNWLDAHATEATINDRTVKTVDFGIDAFDARLRKHGDNGLIPVNLLAPSASLDAPVMLPAYVDLWCQTAPRPVPDPDVSLFLHGPQRGEPDVQVCWRADLVDDDDDQEKPHKHWCDVVALLPPTSAECMRVPIGRLRTWLQEEDAGNRKTHLAKRDDNDFFDRPDEDDAKTARVHVDGVIWRGMTKSKLLKEHDLRPGDTLVLPVSAGGWNDLGHVPELDSETTADAAASEPRASASGTSETSTPEDSASDTPDTEKNGAKPATDHAKMDVAEQGWQRARDRAVLRLHPSLCKRIPDGGAVAALFDRAGDADNPPTVAEWRKLLTAAAESLSDKHAGAKQTLTHLACQTKGLICELYPDRRGVVLTTRKRIGSTFGWCLPALDEGDDEPSRLRRERPVLLAEHTGHVFQAVKDSLQALPRTNWMDALRLAAKLHDLGKADERFQAMLRRTDRTDAWLVAGVTSTLLAKSDGLPMTRTQWRAACRRAGLPDGFRHEMLSVQLAACSDGLPEDTIARDLVLHLIAAHHGRARPFAPVVHDEELPAVAVNGHRLSHEQRKQLVPPHRLDSGIAERFWSLTRRFGWWGLAYLEAVLRLADQQVSAAENANDAGPGNADQPAEVRA